jgi:hypothetical protein
MISRSETAVWNKFRLTLFLRSSVLVCEHLHPLEQALLESGIEETYRGQPWSRNCREWVYFDAEFDTASLLRRFHLPDCLEVVENTDPKSGIEHGLYCSLCKDAAMGKPGSKMTLR